MRLRYATIPAIILTFAVVGCDVDVKDTGRLPDVDVQVQPGQAPDMDVRGPEFDVKTEQRDVTVPDIDIDVDRKKVKVDVPDVDVRIPRENENEPNNTDTSTTDTETPYIP